MNNITLSECLFSKALTWLQDLERSQVQPSQALSKLSELRKLVVPECALDLIWEIAGPDAIIHYDLLVTQSGETVSLSYCSKSEVPWPLRGIQRWSDKDVARINGELLSIEMLMAKLDFVWSDTRLMTRLVDECLIQQEVLERGIQLSDGELQEAMNKFRLQRGLGAAKDTLHWMEARGLTHERFERHVEAQALAEKMKQQVVGGGEESYFELHRNMFDEASVAIVRSADVDWLQSLKNHLLCTGQEQWFVSIQAAIQEGKLRASDFVCKRLPRVEVDEMKQQTQATSLSEFIQGPYHIGSAYELVIILAHHSAQFDESTREVCRDALFNIWLERQRAIANVEWFWGSYS